MHTVAVESERRSRATGAMHAAVAIVALACACAANASASDGAFVAGTAPDRRPEHAPTLIETVRGADWQRRALSGVEHPIPPSIAAFLRDQGDWYTPFSRPGMIGPYDIRGMHVRTAQAAPSDQPSMQVIASAPGWACTRWTHAVPSISGAAPEAGTAQGAQRQRWICTQYTYLGASAADLRPPDSVTREAP